MNYFEGVTKESARSRYMDLAKKYHPDRGGDGETMKLINAQYKELQESGSVYFTNPANGYDPYSRRKLPSSQPASRPTDFWNSHDFSRAAYNAARSAAAQKARQANDAAKQASTREWWTPSEYAEFQNTTRMLRRSGFSTSTTSSFKTKLEELALKRVIAILRDSGLYDSMIGRIERVELTDIGNKWTTFTIITSFADYDTRNPNYIAKMIRSSLKRAGVTNTKFYRLKIENGNLHGFQIQY